MIGRFKCFGSAQRVVLSPTQGNLIRRRINRRTNQKTKTFKRTYILRREALPGDADVTSEAHPHVPSTGDHLRRLDAAAEASHQRSRLSITSAIKDLHKVEHARAVALSPDAISVGHHRGVLFEGEAEEAQQNALIGQHPDEPLTGDAVLVDQRAAHCGGQRRVEGARARQQAAADSLSNIERRLVTSDKNHQYIQCTWNSVKEHLKALSSNAVVTVKNHLSVAARGGNGRRDEILRRVGPVAEALNGVTVPRAEAAWTGLSDLQVVVGAVRRGLNVQMGEDKLNSLTKGGDKVPEAIEQRGVVMRKAGRLYHNAIRGRGGR